MKRVIGQINPSWSVLWNINNLSVLQSALNLFRCPMRNESGMFSPVARELIFLHHKNYNLGYCSPLCQFSAETSKIEYASKKKCLNAGNSLFSITGLTAVAINRPKVLLHQEGGTQCSSWTKDWRSLLYYCYQFWDYIYFLEMSIIIYYWKEAAKRHDLKAFSFWLIFATCRQLLIKHLDLK